MSYKGMTHAEGCLKSLLKVMMYSLLMNYSLKFFSSFYFYLKPRLHDEPELAQPGLESGLVLSKRENCIRVSAHAM